MITAATLRQILQIWLSRVFTALKRFNYSVYRNGGLDALQNYTKNIQKLAHPPYTP